MSDAGTHWKTADSRRWLVLGASGQLGREWCGYLEAQGADYRNFSRDQLDICLNNQVEKALTEYRPHVVINCAAYTKVDAAEEERAVAECVNVSAVRNVARSCAKHNIMLVHFSTDYVFPGLPEHRSEYPDGYPETFPPDPVNYYGYTKWMGERAIRDAGGPHLIVRISWLCGKYGNNFVRTMLRLAGERDHLKVVDDQYGCPSFAYPVVVNTHILIDQGVNGLIHMTSEGVTTWWEFARTIFEIRGLKTTVEAITTSEFPTKAKRPAWSRLAIDKLSEVPGTWILPWRRHLESLLRDIP